MLATQQFKKFKNEREVATKSVDTSKSKQRGAYEQQKNLEEFKV